MGKIVRNREVYSGTYDSATSVNYDNSNSGLPARTVQEGIDTLSEHITTINNNLELFTSKKFTPINATVAGNADRCYISFGINTATIFICLALNSILDSTNNKRVILENVSTVLGANVSISSCNNVAYTYKEKLVKFYYYGGDDCLYVERLTEDIATTDNIYGQLTIPLKR